ncbi:unnamed protein product [Lepeophtheirus salmonis]|uniref:(salmon louse) hypothetical protein n=1 Tax=Lepeophtheirus salmonis TaxID=72036 RepID=A0A7R8CL12_LEPSM|nr:unnamed protein product [Lepeophtheirus salmonis]CAF2824876.1 unnamed protein product [Lepeophtheirus salmonis]
MSAYESTTSRSKKHTRPLVKSYSANPFPDKANYHRDAKSNSHHHHHYTTLSSPHRRVTAKNKSMICSCILHEERKLHRSGSSSCKHQVHDPHHLQEQRRVRGDRLDNIASYHHLPRIRISRSSSREDDERRRRYSQMHPKDVYLLQQQHQQYHPPLPPSQYHHIHPQNHPLINQNNILPPDQDPYFRRLKRSSSAHIVNGRLFKYFQEGIPDFENDDGLGKDNIQRNNSISSSSSIVSVEDDHSSEEEGNINNKVESPDDDPGLGSSETDSLELELAVLNFGEEDEDREDVSSEDNISLICIEESNNYLTTILTQQY